MEKEENWEDVKGYEGLYQVSDLGRVRSIGYGKTKILKPGKNTRYYLSVVLYKEGKRKQFRINRLVAEAFIPNPENLPQVNHKNEVKTDNSVENLEWCDRKYNVNYGSRNKIVAEKLTNRSDESKPVLQFTKSGEFLKEYPLIKEAERQIGVNNSHISDCCRYKRKSASGYIWRYKKVG